MNAIVPAAPPMTYDHLERLAASIAKSGLFGIKTTDQAMALMMIASAEGRHPALAARDYDIIQGKPSKKAEAMMRDFLEAGGKVEWHAVTDALVDATFTHPRTGSVRIDWSIERAKTAELAGKDLWKKYPRQMLRSRVVSEGVRTLWPLATSGMYVPEEVEDFAGKTVEHQPEPDVRDTINAEVPVEPPTPTKPVKLNKANKPKVAPDPLMEADSRKWLVNVEMALADTYSQAEVEKVADHEAIKQAIALAPADIKRRLNELLANAYGRFAETPPAEDLPDVVIPGEEKLAAG